MVVAQAKPAVRPLTSELVSATELLKTNDVNPVLVIPDEGGLISVTVTSTTPVEMSSRKTVANGPEPQQLD